jgi:hypothetical protein
MVERMFDTAAMFGSRSDIVGDLYRLRMDIARAHTGDREVMQRDLELLAAVAVVLGMSHRIVTKASNVPHDRIDQLLAEHHHDLEGLGHSMGYERDATGVVAR